MPKIITNSSKISDKKQIIPKSLINLLTTQLHNLKRVSVPSNENISNYKQNPQILQDKIYDMLAVLQKKLGFYLSGKQQLCQDFVTQFYQNKLDQKNHQIIKIKKENERFIKNIKELQNSLMQFSILKNENQINNNKQILQTKSLLTKQYFQTCSSSFNQISEITKMKQQLSHSLIVIKNNQKFISQQAFIIQQLKQELIKSQKKYSQIRIKYQQKIKDLDFFINKNDSIFKNRIKQFQIQTNSVYKEISFLQKQNVKNIQIKCKFDEQVGKKSQQYHQIKQKYYQLSCQLLKKDQQLRIFKSKFVQNQNITKISQAQSLAFQQKINYLNQKWQIKLQNKLIQIRTLQDLLDSSKRQFLQKDNILEKLNSQINYLKHQIQQLQQYKRINQQNKQSNQDDFSAYTNKLYIMNHQLNSMKGKQQEYERIILQCYQKIETHDYQINQKNNEILIIKQNFDKQTKTLKQNFIKIKQDLESKNQKLQSKIKRLQAQKLQLSQEKQYAQKKLKSLNFKLNELDQNHITAKQSVKSSIFQNNKLKTTVKELQSKNQSLYQTNQALQNQLNKIEKQLLAFQEFDSSRANTSEKQKQRMSNLQHKILQSDQCIKGMSSEIQKLLSQNTQLKNRISQDIQTNNAHKQQVHSQLVLELQKRDSKIKQLKGKITILQQQIRSNDKSNSIEKNRLSVKIKQLQTILGNKQKYVSSSRFPSSLDQNKI